MTNRRLLVTGFVLVALGLGGIAVASVGSGWGPGGIPMMGMMNRTGSGQAAPAPPPIAGAPTVTVRATELSFEPDRLVVPTGEPVNILLINDGAVFHDLAIPALGFRIGAEPGRDATGGLTVSTSGEYDFQCTVPGHAAGGMAGVLVAEGNGPEG